MTPADIGWAISVTFWLIFTVINFIANRKGVVEVAVLTLALQWTSLGFIFIFLGLANGWW